MMNKRFLFAAVGLVCIVFLVFSVLANENVNDSGNKLRVGVYDSRAVAMAHFDKYIREGKLEEIYNQHKKARADGDNLLAEKLEEKGQALQKKLHMRVFGTAEIDDVIKEIKGELAEIAEKHKVDIVVNKWDIAYQTKPSFYIDLTEDMVNLFEPGQETRTKIEAVLKQKPVDNEKLKKMDHSEF